MPISTTTDVVRPIDVFDRARDSFSPQERLNQIRRRAPRFRDAMLAGPRATYYGSFDLIRVPYPTRYALRDACSMPMPLVHILNRMFVVQFQSKTLLVSPSDIERNRETPFFKRLARRAGWAEGLLAPQLGTVEKWLARIGLKPEAVDYITYDHLHTQDLRRWLGASPFFPNAKLLVTRQEWESARALLPPQRDWYCLGGTDGIAPERVILLDGDVMLGESVALVRTPGHTQGNHSIVVHVDEGLFVTSENGVAADAYSPMYSRIPGLRRYAQVTGMEVVLNGNTLEGSVDQYLSMIQEREIAGRSTRDGNFYNVMPSSELTAYWLFPGIRPSFTFGRLEFGTLRS